MRTLKALPLQGREPWMLITSFIILECSWAKAGRELEDSCSNRCKTYFALVGILFYILSRFYTSSLNGKKSTLMYIIHGWKFVMVGIFQIICVAYFSIETWNSDRKVKCQACTKKQRKSQETHLERPVTIIVLSKHISLFCWGFSSAVFAVCYYEWMDSTFKFHPCIILAVALERSEMSVLLLRICCT